MAVQKENQQKLVDFLRQLGLETDQSEAYLYLLEHGPQTVLSLSRGIKSGRTKLYPVLEELAAKRLIRIHERHYGTSYEALEPNSLDFLVNKHEQTASQLRSRLPAILHDLEMLKQSSPATVRLIEYEGIDGLKQINWNLSKASGEYQALLSGNRERQLGKHFVYKLQNLLNSKKITGAALVNKLAPNENLSGVVRYIDPAIFKIEYDVLIYNNVVSLISYDKNQFSGIEIYNSKLTRQQKQLFNLLWQQAQS